jgi:hypothetical protein
MTGEWRRKLWSTSSASGEKRLRRSTSTGSGAASGPCNNANYLSPRDAIDGRGYGGRPKSTN